MASPRSKAQIQRMISDCASYREDLEFIQATLKERNVFIGQLTSGQAGQTEASFCVTIGMYLYGLPELVMSGVPVPVVNAIVEELCEGTDFDREFLAGQRTKLIEELTCMALPIEQPEAHEVLSICIDAYTIINQGHVKAVQLVFADEDGAFPWSKEYSAQERQFQPVLGMSGSDSYAN